MMNKLYIGNLSPAVTADDLRQLFGDRKLPLAGQVLLKSGYAFVDYPDQNWAIRAIETLSASCPAKKQLVIRMIPGGLTEARPATAEVQEIADRVKAQLEEETNEKYEIFKAVEYKTQVVAGVNYFIKMDVGGGCFTHIKVFKDLSGKNNLELTGYQTNKTEDDELTYF